MGKLQASSNVMVVWGVCGGGGHVQEGLVCRGVKLGEV